MRNLFRTLLCNAALVLLLPVGMMAQTNMFEVRFANHAIGTIAAQRKVNGHTKNITIRTRVQMMLSKVNTDLSNDYSNNVLVASTATRQAGKSSDDKATTIRREGNDYYIVHNGAKSTLQETEIQYCVADLYFAEPRQINRVFSETLGRFLVLHPLGGGEYELQLPEGKKNIFKYKDGSLVEVEINLPLGKAYIVRTS